METIRKVRQAHFRDGKGIRETARDLNLARTQSKGLSVVEQQIRYTSGVNNPARSLAPLNFSWKQPMPVIHQALVIDKLFADTCLVFCPSCHQKRVVEFGEWFLDDLAVAVPHRHIVSSIPKLIRRCFLFDRKLLADLSCIAWETLKEYTSTPLSAGNSMPGCACSIQTFGDFLGFNPHRHIIISDGTFDEQGTFHITPYYDAHALEQLFRHKLLKMLLDKGAINQWHIDLLMSWQHSR